MKENLRILGKLFPDSKFLRRIVECPKKLEKKDCKAQNTQRMQSAKKNIRKAISIFLQLCSVISGNYL